MEYIKRLESVKFQSEGLLNIKPDDIDRSLICAICQEILKIPRECGNCHNNFCKKCIDQWLVQKNDLCPFRCPGKIKLNNSHRIIIDALRILTFKCKNEHNGCSFILKYDNYIEHTQNCEYNNLKCINDNCKNILLAKDLKSHLDKECEFQLHKCNICAFEYIGPNVIEHTCAKVAVKQFSELKSEVDNFMIKTTNKIQSISDKLKSISK